MTDPLVSSVNVDIKGAHAHVSVFVRGQLSGTLVMDEADAGQLRTLLLLLGSGERCIPIEQVPWLVKDFHVLYRAAERIADIGDNRAAADLRDLEWVKAQLARLRPAFEECEMVRRMTGNGRTGER